MRRSKLLRIGVTTFAVGLAAVAVSAMPSAAAPREPTAVTFASVLASQSGNATSFAQVIASDVAASSETVAVPLDTPICYVNQDDPHTSGGAGGVIAKTRLICEVGHSTTYSVVNPSLWRCTDQVPGNVSINTPVSKYGCTEGAYETYTNISVSSGATVTRYVPNTDKPGLHGSCYWFAATGYEVAGGSELFYTTMNSASPYYSA